MDLANELHVGGLCRFNDRETRGLDDRRRARVTKILGVNTARWQDSLAMSQPIFTVDAFSARPFTGNPAAVCPLREAADESWMQHVAAEMNLSETAFFWPEA